MNVKKVLKIAGICGGVYVLTNLSYQLGKGRILGIMERDDTENDILELLDTHGKHLPIAERINAKIICFAAKNI